MADSINKEITDNIQIKIISNTLTDRKNEIKSEIRALWQEAFEDPEVFADFYFSEIYSENDLVVARKNDRLNGEIIGMMHLNPYNAQVNGKIEQIYYIVGVATKKSYRRQGVMRKMMEAAIAYMKEKAMPFTFLMPEKEEYYKGFGFYKVQQTYKKIISSKEVLRQITDRQEYEVEFGRDIDGQSRDNIAGVINSKLGQQYDTFCIRDSYYLAKMFREHDCQNGDICIVYNSSGAAAGIFAYDLYGGAEKKCMYIERLVVFRDDFSDGYSSKNSLSNNRIVENAISDVMNNESCDHLEIYSSFKLFEEYDAEEWHGYMVLPINKDMTDTIFFFDELI